MICLKVKDLIFWFTLILFLGLISFTHSDDRTEKRCKTCLGYSIHDVAVDVIRNAMNEDVFNRSTLDFSVFYRCYTEIVDGDTLIYPKLVGWRNNLTDTTIEIEEYIKSISNSAESQNYLVCVMKSNLTYFAFYSQPYRFRFISEKGWLRNKKLIHQNRLMYQSLRDSKGKRGYFNGL